MTEKSLLKPFEPMLASPRGKMKFPCLVQPKYDGIRCVVRNGVAMSRNLAPIANTMIRETLSNPLFNGLDGELIAGDPLLPDVYNKTQDIVMDANADPSRVVYYVFDDFTDPRQQYQLRYLRAWDRVKAQANGPGVAQYVLSETAFSETELMEFADDLFNAGYEGAMVRDPEGLYKHGRATENEGTLWKIKRMQDDEMLVTHVEERMTNANAATLDARGKSKRSHAAAGKEHTGLLGVLVGTSPKWPGVEIRVGSSNLPRIPLGEAQLMFCGKLVVFKHQPSGAKDAPRFPIFKGLRDERDLSSS